VHADPAVESLLAESATRLSDAHGTAEQVFVAIDEYLHCAYQAGLSSDDVRDLLGIAPDCVLDRAGLSLSEEYAILEIYSVIEGTDVSADAE
jgi:hypothetical protein